MTRYLDLEDRQKGYKLFNPTRENFKNNVGKKICWVTKSDCDDYRGTYFVRYGTIYKLRYNELFIDESMCRSINIRNIRECGIKEDEQVQG